MAYEAEKKDLDYLLANRIGSTDNSLVNNRSVTLAWFKIDAKRKQTILDYLNTIVTVTDQKYDSGNATMTGVWRSAGVGFNKQGDYYYIILREGWATSVLQVVDPEADPLTYTLNDECMIAQGTDTRSIERKLILLWRNIALDSVQACINELRAQAYFTNPTVQGEVKTGKYLIGEITPQQQEDGSYSITVSTTRVKQTTPENECKLRQEVHFNQSGKLQMTRVWNCIDPSVVDDLLILNANTNVTDELATDIYADAKKYAGSWLVLRTYKEATENEGYNIVQILIKAGDQKLYTVTGDSRFRRVYEFQLWDASKEAVEAFLADADPFGDASLDPKWETEEVGIAKKVDKQTNGEDRSFNVRAVYTLFLAWKSPNNASWTSFKTVSNINGIYTESILPFKNQFQTDYPTLNAGELIKAVENEVALFDGNLVKRDIIQSGGVNKTFVTVASYIWEWKSRNGEMRFPIWTSSTDSDKPQRITGYNVFYYEMFYRRKVNVSITRQYFNSHPGALGIDEAAADTANEDFVQGGGVGYIGQVLELGEGLFAIETKTITTGDWVKKSNLWEAIATI